MSRSRPGAGRDRGGCLRPSTGCGGKVSILIVDHHLDLASFVGSHGCARSRAGDAHRALEGAVGGPGPAPQGAVVVNRTEPVKHAQGEEERRR